MLTPPLMLRALALAGAPALVLLAARPRRADAAAAAATTAPTGASVSEWLMRMHEASRRRNYIGTFVVSSSTGACPARASGSVRRPRRSSASRRSRASRAPSSAATTRCVTFLPESAHRCAGRAARAAGLFPDAAASRRQRDPRVLRLRAASAPTASPASRPTSCSCMPQGRPALRLPHLEPRRRAAWWSSCRPRRRRPRARAVGVLRAAARRAVRSRHAAQMMSRPTAGASRTPTLRADHGSTAEGWALQAAGAGLPAGRAATAPLDERRRRRDGAGAAVDLLGRPGLRCRCSSSPTMPQRHLQRGQFASGATQTLTRRVQDWWLTAVGEVPPQTLRLFARALSAAITALPVAGAAIVERSARKRVEH